MLAPAVTSWFTRILDVCHPATIAENIVQAAEVQRVTGVGPAHVEPVNRYQEPHRKPGGRHGPNPTLARPLLPHRRLLALSTN